MKYCNKGSEMSQNNTEKEIAEIRKIEDVVRTKLSIPDYQRHL
ncbi:hypothetical protein COI_0787 [Mannheimia haemolytica serotype A2 str. OVINE]|nr:hypothetical protein COI_0787 [Mannheimia haemolytica serotype A2 str. OVINE]